MPPSPSSSRRASIPASTPGSWRRRPGSTPGGIGGCATSSPATHAVTVYFDPLRADAGRVWTALEEAVTTPAVEGGRVPGGRDPRCATGGGEGPDLEEVAAFAGCSAAEGDPAAHRDHLSRLHGRVSARVRLSGHRGSPDSDAPARDAPAGGPGPVRVGIAGRQTGVYPTAAPGGWRPHRAVPRCGVFDALRHPPGLFGPGDRVRFEPAPPGRIRRASSVPETGCASSRRRRARRRPEA